MYIVECFFLADIIILSTYCSLSPVKSFTELVPQLFAIPGVKVFLSERINQDPLEKFFGCQRQRGGRNENPTVAEFYKNTQALRVINSFCVGPVKGNCRNQTTEQGRKTDCDKENTPLPKRRKIK